MQGLKVLSHFEAARTGSLELLGQLAHLFSLGFEITKSDGLGVNVGSVTYARLAGVC